MTRRWLIDLPTRIHLWSAEFQIRHRSPSSDPARLRNLDVLRDYRKSRAFPRNDTDLPSTPYFVDADGRHCAVGHLMRESGEHDAVRRIAAESNLARIDDMDPALLTDWTERSGLTKRELARIQPGYPHEQQWLADQLLWSALLMVPLALLSFVLSRIHLDRVAVRRVVVVVALLLCTVFTKMAQNSSGMATATTPIEMFVWFAELLCPIVGAVVIAAFARHGSMPPDGVAPVSGVLTGGLAIVFATAYLVLDVVVPNPSEDSREAGLPDHPSFSSTPAVVALVLGMLTLVWAVWRLRRSIADSRA
jgi:hypothetical protein